MKMLWLLGHYLHPHLLVGLRPNPIVLPNSKNQQNKEMPKNLHRKNLYKTHEYFKVFQNNYLKIRDLRERNVSEF